MSKMSINIMDLLNMDQDTFRDVITLTDKLREKMPSLPRSFRAALLATLIEYHCAIEHEDVVTFIYQLAEVAKNVNDELGSWDIKS